MAAEYFMCTMILIFKLQNVNYLKFVTFSVAVSFKMDNKTKNRDVIINFYIKGLSIFILLWSRKNFFYCFKKYIL